MRCSEIENVRPSKRAGIATLEMALIAPLMIAMFLGTLELSRALHVRQVLSDSCRTGARIAVQPGVTVAEVDARARAVVHYNKLDSSKLAVTVAVNGVKVADLSSAKEGDFVGVTTTLPAGAAAFVSPIFLPSDRSLTAAIVMMRQK